MTRSGQYSKVVPSLGHGVGLQPEFYSTLLSEPAPPIDFLELDTDTFLQPSRRMWSVAQRVREQMPLTLHGLGLGLGNQRGPSPQYLQQLGVLIDHLAPALVSDHLCWTSYRGRCCHDPLPLPRTASTLARVVRHIERAQTRLKRRILVENVTSYVEFRENEMSEREFLSEVAQRADCWILLDVGSVYINAINHGYDPVRFVAGLPHDRVRQIHLAGHTRDEDGDNEPLLIDTRSGCVPEAVWQLYRTTLRHCPDTPTVVEWQHDVPSLQRLVVESTRARNLAVELATNSPERISA